MYATNNKVHIIISSQTMNILETGWQKLREGAKGIRQKVWTLTAILSPNIRYFDTKICHDLRVFKAFFEL